MSEVGQYDAVLLVSFGGPEAKQDVMPFLENVTRGRNVPRERLLEVAEHYEEFGGVSPLNGQVRDLREALQGELQRIGIDLPIHWGNRNWHPLLPDTMAEMASQGVRRVLAVVLAAYSSYSSCRQYLENIETAREAVRETVGADPPLVDKVRAFFNHPEFVAANAECLAEALVGFEDADVAFTAHSIPAAMSGECDYAAQLTETGRLVAEACGVDPGRWQVVYQSRSGRPQDTWLEPDIGDHVRSLHQRGAAAVVVHPIGFLSDHLEVLFDLDVEAAAVSAELGLRFRRAATVGVHPRFVGMLGELIAERCQGSSGGLAVGSLPPCPDACPTGCCPSGRAVRGEG
jgi:ferrochelatase